MNHLRCMTTCVFDIIGIDHIMINANNDFIMYCHLFLFYHIIKSLYESLYPHDLSRNF